MDKKTMPAQSITIIIGENQYKIGIPTNGKIIDMERMKIELTNGTLKDMLFSVGGGPQTYLLVETIATFTVLIPDLSKDLLVKSLLDLDPMKTKAIIKQYETVFYPWWSEWQKVWNADEEEEKPKDEKK